VIDREIQRFYSKLQDPLSPTLERVGVRGIWVASTYTSLIFLINLEVVNPKL
jgi:hypothetical protein